MMQEWLKKQMSNTDMSNKIYFIKNLCSCDWDINQLPANFKNNNNLISFLQNDIRNVNDKFFCEIYDDVFLHYRAGGNWRKEGLGLHYKLSQFLKNCLL
jgi:hypothetical protein